MIGTRLNLRRMPDFLFRHPWLAFVLMGVSFLLLGLTSVNLYMLLAANIGLFLEYGTMVIADGALRQLVGLLGSLVLCLLFFVVFALCERSLVRRLTEKALRGRGAD
jgi:phosphotransferase system  glucose/maltose/N-acetylglucosamine-specific IIC component